MSEPLRLSPTSGLDIEDAKSLVRQELRRHRRGRSSRALAELEEQFTARALEAIGGARHVALYVSTGSEPPTRTLLESLHARNVSVLLPVLGAGLSRQWALYQGAHDLAERAPGRPPEPSGPALDASAITGVEAVITPGLAVDCLGTRLGQGGGWYDRMLAQLTDDVPVFTMLFDDELISDQLLPRDEFDQPVPAVITPTRVFLIEGSPYQSECLKRLNLRG